MSGQDGCPVCGHDRDAHGYDGCIDGWVYAGGQATAEGCQCIITGWVSQA